MVPVVWVLILVPTLLQVVPDTGLRGPLRESIKLPARSRVVSTVRLRLPSLSPCSPPILG